MRLEVVSIGVCASVYVTAVQMCRVTAEFRAVVDSCPSIASPAGPDAGATQNQENACRLGKLLRCAASKVSPLSAERERDRLHEAKGARQLETQTAVSGSFVQQRTTSQAARSQSASWKVRSTELVVTVSGLTRSQLAICTPSKPWALAAGSSGTFASGAAGGAPTPGPARLAKMVQHGPLISLGLGPFMHLARIIAENANCENIHDSLPFDSWVTTPTSN